MRQFTLFAIALGVLAVASGCRICDRCRLFRKSDTGRLDAPTPPRVGSDPLLIPPPSGGLPTPPADTRGPDLPPPTLPPESRNYLPPATKPNGKELVLPDPLPGASGKNGFLESPGEVRKADSTTAKSLPKDAPAKSLPGVSEFTSVREGLATGRKPSIEGFDSLKGAGFKTFVYLHDKTADVAAAKSVAEQRGLEFVAIPVTETTIADAYKSFVAAIAKPSTYVGDGDGVRAGILWYLHFRIADNLSDDAAQVRAAPLGLRETSVAKAKLWAAAQDYLAKK